MSMSETLVTVTGNVATRPEMRVTASGAQLTRFRLATTERRFDRTAERWVDGHTNFFTVWTWRTLAENVAASVGIGEPVIVQGRLRVSEREDKGQTFITAGIDAVVVGHDLSRGTSAFRRATRAARPDPFATTGEVEPLAADLAATGAPPSPPGDPVARDREPDLVPS
jgi:single-strand DNA-binding protein